MSHVWRKARIVENATWWPWRRRLAITLDIPHDAILERLRASTRPWEGQADQLAFLIRWESMAPYEYCGDVTETLVDLVHPITRPWWFRPRSNLISMHISGTVEPVGGPASPGTGTIVSVTVGPSWSSDLLCIAFALAPLGLLFLPRVSLKDLVLTVCFCWGMVVLSYFGYRQNVGWSAGRFVNILQSPPRRRKPVS